MMNVLLFVLWITSFISSVLCAAVGFVGTGMGSDGITFLGTLMMASPIIITIIGVLALRAKSWTTVMMLSLIHI